MSKYTVKQLAKLANVSVRTLHHYHQIGLLIPAYIGANTYRYYADNELLRLQQILFYREFGMGLKEISILLDKPDFDTRNALLAHKARLASEMKRYRDLIATIDRTIAGIDGEKTMKNQNLYKGLTAEENANYESDLVNIHGEKIKEHIATSKAHNAKKSDTMRGKDMDELAEIETGLAAFMHAGVRADDAKTATLIARHRDWVSGMWGRDCPPQAHVNLAEMYETHPGFQARYESIATGYTKYLCDAIRAHSG
ncbi:MAG: MerR family transcriptional regulator [Paracoccaceae bacterium]